MAQIKINIRNIEKKRVKLKKMISAHKADEAKKASLESGSAGKAEEQLQKSEKRMKQISKDLENTMDATLQFLTGLQDGILEREEMFLKVLDKVK